MHRPSQSPHRFLTPPGSRLLLSTLSLLSAPWLESAAHAQYNGTIFGPNVCVFDSSVPGTTINTQLDAITNPSVAQAQFSMSRSAVLFKPGTYTGVSHQVGFYTLIAGLGTTPDATVLNGSGLYLDVTDSSGHVTTNFWRSLENLRINVPTGGTDRWAVAQGAAFRRMHVAGGPLQLTNAGCGYASGGFIADTSSTARSKPARNSSGTPVTASSAASTAASGTMSSLASRGRRRSPFRVPSRSTISPTQRSQPRP